MTFPGYFEFCCPVHIVSGHRALEQIPLLLRGLKASRPLLVTDAGVSGAGLVETVVAAVKAEIDIVGMEDDVPPDSDLDAVKRIAGAYRRTNADAIIAVGGGSVMDTAKGVNLMVSENSDDLMRFTGAGALKRRLNPLVAVPTTAGTGSEVTLVAVIKNRERRLKMLFTSTFLLPDAAVLDSRMTLSLPPALTAATAMDALTHAVEAYTCLQKNPLSDAHATAAVELIRRHLLRVVSHPEDRDSRLALANAATLAGIAFSNAMVGMVHTLGHSVGAVCQVPHGVCMAVLLPYGLEYNFHKNAHLTAELLLPMAGVEPAATTPVHLRAERVIAAIRQLNQTLHETTGGRHPRNLAEIRDRNDRPMVPAGRLADIAEKALEDGSIFYNPEELDFADFLMVLEAAWRGEPLDRSRIRKG